MLKVRGRQVTEPGQAASFNSAMRKLMDKQEGALRRKVMNRRVPTQDQVRGRGRGGGGRGRCGARS